MTNLTQQVKQGAEQALASIAHGWRELKDRASGALTHFQPRDEKSGETGGELSSLGSWGFMAADVSDGQMRLEAPGMSRSDFKIELRGEMLSIQGEKRIERCSRAKALLDPKFLRLLQPRGATAGSGECRQGPGHLSRRRLAPRAGVFRSM